MMRIASPGPTGVLGARSAGAAPDAPVRLRVGGGPGGVGGAHRVAVHPRVRERRHRVGRDDLRRENTAQRVGERHV